MPRKPDPNPSQHSLFDPGRTRAAESATSADDTPLRVAQLCALIDRAIRNNTPQRVRVQGEISNLTDRTHWYFTLKDADASLGCVMFASQAKRVKFQPEAGQEVIATGRVEFYAPQGRTQLYVENLEPVGIGALELTLKKRLDDLKSQGLLDPERKRALPRFPRRIAVFTSATGAAWHDVRDTFARRAPWIELLRVDILVQGDGASPSIVRALAQLKTYAARLHIDAAILTRGGGSLEDLWAFNELEVAHAIAASPVPIVAAIGHETDTTIAELIADERAATPTQAAMRLSPDRDALLEQIRSLDLRLGRAFENQTNRVGQIVDELLSSLTYLARAQVQRKHLVLERIAPRLERAKPSKIVEKRLGTLDKLHARLTTCLGARATLHDPILLTKDLDAALLGAANRAGVRLDGLDRSLRIAGPPSVLTRGYSITQDDDGNVITDARSVRAGQRLRTRLREGVVWSAAGDKVTKRVKPTEKGKEPHQFDLFGESGQAGEAPSGSSR